MNFTHGSIKKPFLATALRTSPPGRGLAGLDGAAQAGMIKAELSNLPAVRGYMLVARFAAAHAPCACRSSCCRGARENPDWSEAVNFLTEYVLVNGLTGTISHYRLRRALVTRFFGQRESFSEIAQACGVHRTTASEYNKAVVERFRAEERLAFYEIEGRLKAGGIVDS